MSELVATSILQPAPDIVWREVAGEMVLLDPEGSVIMGLNGTGGRVWSLLDGRMSLQEIAKTLANEFEINAEVALEDALAFSKVLLARGLTRLAGE